MRGLGLTPPSDGVPQPHPHSTPLSLTWCQFCMERLILGTEPGCSLFMSLGGGIWDGGEKGTSISVAELQRPKRLIHAFLANLTASLWASVSPLAIQSSPTKDAKMPKSDNNQHWEYSPEPPSLGSESGNFR